MLEHVAEDGGLLAILRLEGFRHLLELGALVAVGGLNFFKPGSFTGKTFNVWDLPGLQPRVP